MKHKKGLLRRGIPSSIASREELRGGRVVAAATSEEPGVKLIQSDAVLKMLAALRAGEVSSDTSGDDTTNIAGREAMVAAATKQRSRKCDMKRYVKVIVTLRMGEQSGGKVGNSQQQYTVKAELGETLRSITDKALHNWGITAEDVGVYVFQEGTKQIVNNREKSLRELGIGTVEREPHVELLKKVHLNSSGKVLAFLLKQQ